MTNIIKHDNRRNKNKRKARVERGEQRIIQDKYMESRKRPPVEAKTQAQKLYLEYLSNKQWVIAEGSAGSGKSFCVATVAADRLLKGDISKVIVARSYVQTGKTSGFKKGSAYEKLFPYVRNILDTMKKRMGVGAYETNLKDALTGNIEVQEVESIRGRSFDEDSMLIIEEAQQCSIEEIQSICSRVSDRCQLIISGDPKQKDIKGESGLEWLCKFVKRHNLKNVGLVHFTTEDCVRGGLVKDFLIGLDTDNKKI